jgi:hypothetical protein
LYEPLQHGLAAAGRGLTHSLSAAELAETALVGADAVQRLGLRRGRGLLLRAEHTHSTIKYTSPFNCRNPCEEFYNNICGP